MRFLLTSLSLLVALGCGSSGGGSTDPGVRPPGGSDLPCRAAQCGDARVRNAIPTRDLVRIDFGGAAGTPGALADYSPFYEETELYVDNINDIIDEIFSDLEFAAGEEPTVEGSEHIWRASEGDVDVVLDIEEVSATTFHLSYYEGAPGFEPDTTMPIVDGEVTLDGDDAVQSFELFVDLDVLSAADPSVVATGDMYLAAAPFAGGIAEVIFDLREVSWEGDAAESSQTTYWVFGVDDHALEYLADIEGLDGDVELTAFVRWDDEGGRWDSHALYDHGELGLVDYITTNCWDFSAAELFHGEAWIQDATLDFYGELDGSEANCHFGPVSGHPNPSADFDDLPGEGEWQAIDFLGCDPLDPSCEDECDPAVEDCCDPAFEDCEPECDPAVEDCCDPAFEDCCDPAFEDCCDPAFEDCCDPEFEDCCDPAFEDCCDPDFEDCF